MKFFLTKKEDSFENKKAEYTKRAARRIRGFLSLYQPTAEKYQKKITEWREEENIIVCANPGENKLKGMVVFRLCQNDTAEIIGIAVHPTYRLQGIGSALIKQVAKEYGIEKIVAETDDDAVLFYQKSGFDIQKTERQFLGEKAVRYTCTLTAK